MSMSVGAADSDQPLMEMNTTPLIDVMLVMLIMFIITLPVQTHAVKIDLPVPTDSNEPLVDPVKNKVTIDAAGVVRWNGNGVDLATLANLLEQTKSLPNEPELQIQPDPLARYIVFDNVVAVIKRSAVGKVGFVGNEQYARAF